MAGSVVVYAGLLVALLGLVFVVRPIVRLGVRRRVHGLLVGVVGIGIVAAGLLLPAPEKRIAQRTSQLDAFVSVWQFNEFHTIRIAAPPERVFDAVRRVRADEIALFRTLTWIRRGGRPLPESILNAGDREPLIDVATRSGFVRLADDPPRELVIGTVVAAPPGTKGPLTPEFFAKQHPPGFALAAMNFAVRPDQSGGSIVTTETRVFATSEGTRRRFAVYWRFIYPGSAIIRRMWLRAIERRALSI